MAVQKSKKSRARRGNRRAHQHAVAKTVSVDSFSGEQHLRHHISKDGYYRGREIIKPKTVVMPQLASEESA